MFYQTRSELMSSIRGKGNKKTELVLAKAFRAKGLKGWRRHVPLSGKPDFVFLKQKIAVFADGCFWHGCKECYREPKKNTAFWRNKITTNQARDRRVTAELQTSGWTVFRFWEHELSSPDFVASKGFEELSAAVHSGMRTLPDPNLEKQSPRRKGGKAEQSA